MTQWVFAIHATCRRPTTLHLSRTVPSQARRIYNLGPPLLMQSQIGQEGMHNSLFNRILTGLWIQTTKRKAEFLFDLGEHGDEV
jgi:hypothetical protein